VVDAGEPRDSFVDLAKSELKAFFGKVTGSVFYQRRLQAMFEKRYFHWVTARALSELVQEGRIAIEFLALPEIGIVKFVSQFPESSFTLGLGRRAGPCLMRLCPQWASCPQDGKCAHIEAQNGPNTTLIEFLSGMG
jgi:hypothetical protein